METPQDAEEKARAIMAQLEMSKKQMEALNRQAEMVEGALMELRATTSALKALKDEKRENEILVQVGSGSYLRAKLDDTENVLVGIGGNLTVEKTIPDAVDTLDVRGKKLTESMVKLQKSIGELGMRMSDLNRVAESMMGPPK